jgi:geranylgeranyl diphosphate synthase type II
LTLAFEVMLEQKNVEPAVLVETVKEIAMCAGKDGMVGGQTLDLAAEGKKISAKEMKTLHEAKTGALFLAAVRSGARLGGASSEQMLALTRFAELFGLAFQISDDILDVIGDAEEMGKATGSDSKLQKSTYVTLYGLEKAETMATETLQQAMACLNMFEEKAEPLREITKMMDKRKK